MRLMLRAAAVGLAVFVCSAAAATTLGWDVTTAGDTTTYTYSLTSSEFNDWITALHVYAPCTPGLVTGWTAEKNWLFTADPDIETGGADIYWSAVDPIGDGLAYGQTIQVSMSVPASAGRDDNYIVPGYIGNWGYETYNFAGWGVLVSFPSVPVPVGGAPAPVPEPLTIITLASGIVLVALRRR